MKDIKDMFKFVEKKRMILVFFLDVIYNLSIYGSSFALSYFVTSPLTSDKLIHLLLTLGILYFISLILRYVYVKISQVFLYKIQLDAEQYFYRKLQDMDPKNIMWNNGNPWVIDLECLDYGNPISHALQLALQWAGIVTCDINLENIVAFFNGYLEAYDNGFRRYSDVFGLSYTWVEWLEYNIRRALGSSMDESERAMGISEVKNTIDRIKYIQKNEKRIKDVLDSCLLQSETRRFDM